MTYKTYSCLDDPEIKKILNVGDDEILDKTFEIYSFKFPDNSIYVGYTPNGLEQAYNNHSRCSISPINKYIKEYPEVRPEVEFTVAHTTYNELDKLRRRVLDSNLNMKILNISLKVLGY